MAGKVVVEFQRVTLGYTQRLAIENVCMQVNQGEFIAITGPNGSGKSTMLKAIVGLSKPLKGQIRVFGEDPFRVRSLRQRLGYLPQRELIDPRFPILVKEAVLMGRYSSIGLLREPKAEDRDMVLKALRQVEMEEFAHEPLGHLSGGQQQRVLIARALAQEPDILLLDEPTAGIDVQTQAKIIDIIRRVHKENGKTILMVTHDLEQIRDYVDRLFYLDDKRLYVTEDTHRGLGGRR